MHPPSFFLLGLATAFAPLSTAHTVLTTLFINDASQGDGTCIRMPKDGSTCTYPIAGLNNPDMACGKDGQNPVAFTCPIPAGGKLSFEFRSYGDQPPPKQPAIDASHKGSTAIYLKSVGKNSILDSPAAGQGWFKIFDDGYDKVSGLWATDKLNSNNGHLSITLPTGLPIGYYLVRTEIMTLQNVTNHVVAPQFFVNCAQLFISSSTASDLSIPSANKASIPGHVSASDPGLTFNVYETPYKSDFVIPGPATFFPASPPTTKSNTLTSAKEPTGAVPKTCLLKNANWCGVQTPAYSNSEDACWASAQNCWDQGKACFDSAPPSGYSGCKKWNDEKCQAQHDACASKDFNGPPSMGTNWGGDVSTLRKVDLPPVANANAGAGASAGKPTEEGNNGGGGEETPSAFPSTPPQAVSSAAPAPTQPVGQKEGEEPMAPVSSLAPAPTAGSSCGGHRRRRRIVTVYV
ncbi:glycosyl hydrolase family 61-domain-containing protein [Podospora didyma]|uniref:lytic cellulose monooxygenase (C4-dehydrogenating) n=1 Tax=Podospora didyma TaxID=330526 RepID=A0AAE0U4F1_9PEZI|nr:glycosyl hydrolase family 61-domain-containing protein [Podospora didyma]